MDGYTRHAAITGSFPDFAIFRRFMPLRALRLLHLSADIAQLADELGVQVDIDRNSGDPEKVLFEFYYRKLLASRNNVQKARQIELWDRLALKLKEQGDTLLQYRCLLRLPSVNPDHLDNLQAWMHSDEGGHGFLHGAEAAVYFGENRDDLTSLSANDGSTDALTALIHSFILPWYHRVFGRQYKHRTTVPDPFTGERQQVPIFYYSDRLILFFINTVSTILASLIPAICTLALFYIRTSLARMGALIAFTFLFSTILSLVANVKRSECFGITAAFSAVLVVFVGGNITNSDK